MYLGGIRALEKAANFAAADNLVRQWLNDLVIAARQPIKFPLYL